MFESPLFFLAEIFPPNLEYIRRMELFDDVLVYFFMKAYTHRAYAALTCASPCMCRRKDSIDRKHVLCLTVLQCSGKAADKEPKLSTVVQLYSTAGASSVVLFTSISETLFLR